MSNIFSILAVAVIVVYIYRRIKDRFGSFQKKENARFVKKKKFKTTRKSGFKDSSGRIRKTNAEIEEQLSDLKLDSKLVDIPFLVEQLDYIGQKPEEQLKKRLEAIEQIKRMGNKAYSAIPALIKKSLSKVLEERKSAIEALETIDPKWPENEAAEAAVPFLIHKLDKDRLIANRAKRALILIGEATAPLLSKKLASREQVDPYFTANVLDILSRIRPKINGLLPPINQILLESEANFLLEAAAEAICRLEEWSDETLQGLSRLVKNEDAAVREKALEALDKIDSEAGVAPMLRCLSDPNKNVREKAIETLSRKTSPAASEFYEAVVKNKGALKGEDWKPELLLQSVLKILSDQQFSGGGLTEVLLEVYRKSYKVSMLRACLEVLSNISRDSAIIIPVLVRSLNADSEVQRKTCIEALNKLDPQWIERPVSIEAIKHFIEKLDSAQKLVSKNALISIGEPAIPFLSAYLEKTENRVIRQTIIEILKEFGSRAKTTLPVLRRVKEKSDNAHTLTAINELIEQINKT